MGIKIRHIAVALLISFSILKSSAITPYAEAALWCDNNMLQPIEGIWEYPDDNTRVLIQADNTVPGSFSITVISSPDCRIATGNIIGRLYASIDSKQYRLKQWTKKDNRSLSKPFDCTAVLSSDEESIRIKSPKIKFKVNPTTILPKFWRLIRISIDKPADDLPTGLIKIYPGYDHNGSLRRIPRIL